MSTHRFRLIFLLCCLLLSCMNPGDDDGKAIPDEEYEENDAARTDDDTGEDPVTEARLALDRAARYLLNAQFPEGYWMGSFVTDTSFTADYILLMHYLERVNETRQKKAVQYILNEQQPDGGWAAYPDGPSVQYISVIDYLALKLAGLPADNPALVRARAFIHSQGGAERTNLLVKTKLALFGQVPWRTMIGINTSVMGLEELLYKIGYFHSVFIPLTVIYENYHRILPPEGHGIAEIFLTDPWEGVVEFPPRQGHGEAKAVEWILKRQEADGNWAGVFSNTMISLIALKSTGDPSLDPIIDQGMAGVELFQNEDETTINQQFSQPPVMDTAYVLHVLLAAGVDPQHASIQKAVEWLIGKQSTEYGDWSVLNPEGEPGGWAFEHENRFYPDVDCTVMVLDALALLDASTRTKIADSIQRGLDWTLSMQCADGGWAAWDKDAVDPARFLPWLEGQPWLPKDVSWEDISSRVILALANLDGIGYTINPAVSQRAIQFLKSRQEPFGGWFGRWGTNYTYATGQILQGLMAAGEDPTQVYLKQAVQWLKMMQNGDGGWGEDNASYLDPSLAGVGESTIFQTAYVLIGLISAGAWNDDAVEQGIRYLIKRQKDDGSWYDEQFLGTNLPGYWYSRYDMLSTYKAAYALAFYLRHQAK